MESKEFRQQVFIRRKKVMPFAEYKKVCIERFREAGLLQEEKTKTPSPRVQREGEE